MAKKRSVTLTVDEKWFTQVFEKNRQALQKKLNKSNISQSDFTRIDLKVGKLLKGVRRKTGL